MVQAESKVKRRIAPPRALGVEEYRSARPAQDVLRTDVAVHERAMRPGGGRHECFQLGRQIGMSARGGEQVRLQPDRVKDRVGREGGGDRRIGGAGGVDAGERGADRGGEAGIGATLAQARLPQRKYRGLEVLHRQHLGRRIMAEQCRSAARNGGVGAGDPARFVQVPFDRRVPVGCHEQAFERALHADRSRREIDPPDVGGDTAGQPARRRHGRPRSEQADAAKRVGDWRRQLHLRRLRQRTRSPSLAPAR